MLAEIIYRFHKTQRPFVGQFDTKTGLIIGVPESEFKFTINESEFLFSEPVYSNYGLDLRYMYVPMYHFKEAIAVINYNRAGSIVIEQNRYYLVMDKDIELSAQVNVGGRKIEPPIQYKYSQQVGYEKTEAKQLSYPHEAYGVYIEEDSGTEIILGGRKMKLPEGLAAIASDPLPMNKYLEMCTITEAVCSINTNEGEIILVMNGDTLERR